MDIAEIQTFSLFRVCLGKLLGKFDSQDRIYIFLPALQSLTSLSFRHSFIRSFSEQLGCIRLVLDPEETEILV